MKNIFVKKLISLVLVLSIAGSFLVPAKKAEAQYAVFDAAANATLKIIATATGISAGADETLTTKELIFDAIMFAFINTLIEELTGSIVNWINGGFEGKPLASFVQNFKKHFEDLDDKIFGAFIEEFDLEFVCSPFADRLKRTFEIQLAASEGRSSDELFPYRAQCTIDDVLSNLDSSISEFEDDFTKGGWEAWLTLSEPQNNELGAYVIWKEELARRQAEAETNSRDEIISSGGFLSFKKTNCETFGNPDDLEPVTEECTTEIATPGSVVEDQLNEALGAPGRRLEVADEIDEIISALFRQLLNQVLGPDGLFGASSDDDGGPSYVDQILEEAEQNRGDLEGEQSEVFGLGLDDYIDKLNSYINQRYRSVNRIRQTVSGYSRLVACYEEGAENGINYSQEINQTLSDINSLVAETSRILGSTQDAVTLRDALVGIRDGEVSLTPEELSEIRREANLIDSRFNITQAEEEFNDVDSAMDTRDSSITSRLNECQQRNRL